MLTCQYILWKRENTGAQVIRKCVVLGTQTSLSGPYDLKHKQIPSWLDESAATCRILPPRAVQTLIRGERKCVRLCKRECVGISPWPWCVLSHQAGGKTPPLLVFHSTAFVIGRSQEFFNTTLAPFVLTCHDDQADQENKTWGETLSEWTASLFSQDLPRRKRHDGAGSYLVYFQDSFNKKKQQECPHLAVCTGPMKHMWWLECCSSQTFIEWSMHHDF